MTDFHWQTMSPLDEAPCSVEQPMPRLPESEAPANARLIAEGWQRRFMADGQRLTEYTDLYTSLGFEVYTEPVPPEAVGPECGSCRLVICRQFVTLYTRRRA